MANKSNLTFIDFITEIAKECLSNTGTEASPYDVEFANHYQSLYDSPDCQKQNRMSAEPMTV